MPPTSDSDDALRRAYEALNNGNYADALSLFNRLAEEGVAQANVYLGWMYQKSLGTNLDLEMAEKCYRAAAATGFVLGEYYLASLLRLRGDLSEALRWYEKAAAQQHSSANYWAAVMYRDGEGTAPDKAKAERYLRSAASLGHYFAERDLARDRLRLARSPMQIMQALVAYIRAVVRGSVAAFRNPDEIQLR